LAKRAVVPQRPPNTEAKVTGVRIYKTRSNSSIATMSMNECQFVFPHFPSLLHNFAKSSVEYDFSRMVAVKVNFHLFPFWFPRDSKPTGCHGNEKSAQVLKILIDARHCPENHSNEATAVLRKRIMRSNGPTTKWSKNERRRAVGISPSSIASSAATFSVISSYISGGASASSGAPRSAQILGEIVLNRGSREDKENALSQILRFTGDLYASAGGSITGAS
jgi:hypothetical protein